jgi:pimeloyl-ACP methyl ester carboxylesterase
LRPSHDHEGRHRGRRDHGGDGATRRTAASTRSHPVPVVVCLHASASSSRQWRALTDRLGHRFRVLAPDLYGSGESPLWTGDRQLGVADELALLERTLALAEEPFHLVGHSYGASIALHLALAYPDRVASLALFEPVLFRLLITDDPDQPAAKEITTVRDDALAAIARGATDAAAERFVDYWMGPGSWANMPASRKAATASAMHGVRSQFHAIFNDDTPLSAFASLNQPVTLWRGALTRASARGVGRLLSATLPQVTTVELDGLGHMAPISHPDDVNSRIDEHLTKG